MTAQGVQIEVLKPKAPSLSARLFSSSSSKSPPSKQGGKHADPKAVFEGLQGASLQAALNQPKQLEHILKSEGDRAAQERDADGDRFPLHWAVARGHAECVRLLLSYGAESLAKDASGKTPAVLAAELGQTDVLVFLGDGAMLSASP